MDFSVLLTVVVSCQGYTWHSHKKDHMFWTPTFQKSFRENKLWKYSKLLIYGYFHKGYLRVALKIKAGWVKLLVPYTITFPSVRQNLLQKCIPFQRFGLLWFCLFACLFVYLFLTFSFRQHLDVVQDMPSYRQAILTGVFIPHFVIEVLHHYDINAAM